ncbi:MAG TPA: TonB family protein [Polyangiaceae bacterium]
MRRSLSSRGLGWVLSGAVHIAAITGLASTPAARHVRRPNAEVTFSVVSQPRPAAVTPLPTSKPPPLAAPVRPTATKPASQPRAAKASPPVPAAAPSPEPAALTGVTLTGGDGAAWSSVVGNGAAIAQPIVPTVIAPPRPTISNAASGARLAQAEPALVPLRDLSTKPSPPALNGQLLNNYPPDAKRRGIAGKAVVKATIEADGSVRRVHIGFESEAGFGIACQKTLLGSRWSPPRDKQGRAVSTEIRYTCDFRVDG